MTLSHLLSIKRALYLALELHGETDPDRTSTHNALIEVLTMIRAEQESQDRISYMFRMAENNFNQE